MVNDNHLVGPGAVEMKKFVLGFVVTMVLLATRAIAADLPASQVWSAYPAPTPLPTSYNWTSCYAGGHAGVAAGVAKWTDSSPLGFIDTTLNGQTANTNVSGAVYGAQIGCDYQFFGNFVVGIDASISGASLTGTNADQFNPFFSLRVQNDWLASVTGRLGVAMDRVLLYTRGGIAWAHETFEIENAAILDGTPSIKRLGWVWRRRRGGVRSMLVGLH
jgi:outer membrane immunogenic protein